MVSSFQYVPENTNEAVNVYLASDVKTVSPAFFIGCAKTVNLIITKRDIPQSEYFFVSRVKDNGYKQLPHDSTYKARKLLLTERWVHEHVPGFIPDTVPVVVEKEEIRVAPPILILEEHEAFRDVHGNIAKVTVRGERKIYGIFFKATDIGKIVGTETIRKTITDKNGSFIKDIDYVYFKCKKNESHKNNIDINDIGDLDSVQVSYKNMTVERTKETGAVGITFSNYENTPNITSPNGIESDDRKLRDIGGVYAVHTSYDSMTDRNDDTYIDNNNKTIYLTYEGLIGFLFRSKSEYARIFQKWALNLLYTAQLGTEEQKEELIPQLNANSTMYKTVFSSKSSPLSAIYVLKLGKVSDLRESFNISNDIDNNHIVIKFGMTDDLNRRLSEHCTYFNKYKNVNVELICFEAIDKQYLRSAENMVKKLLCTSSYSICSDHDEVIHLDKKWVKLHMRDIIRDIGCTFSSKVDVLLQRLHDLEIYKENYHLHKEEIKSIYTVAAENTEKRHENEKQEIHGIYSLLIEALKNTSSSSK